MTDLSCLLRTTQQTQHAHRALQALQQAWLTVDQQQLSVEPFLVQRSLVIVQQLQQLPFQTEIGTSLQQLAQHIAAFRAPLAITEEDVAPLLAVFQITMDAEHTPWLVHPADTPLPESLQHMGAGWRQAIQASKDKPLQRLQLAIQMLPYSTAFYEAAIALRAILRENLAEPTPTLQLLYWLAVLHSFIAVEPETPSGDLVAQALPAQALLTLDWDYDQLGLDQLPLLNITDKQLFQEYWGSETQHQRLKDLYPDLWQSYVKNAEPA
ncbi:MAG TPA: hypothetical protein GXX62_06490 [Alcaligenaceae bacterium]|nr:hypothetical protein [Alcaligenaceae bacterium]